MFDALLAAMFVVIGQTDVWVPWGDDGSKGGFDGPGIVSAILVLMTTAPLLWRRRRPLAVVTVMAAAMSIEILFVSHTAAFFGGFLPVLVAVYSVATYAPRRTAALGLGVVALELAIVDLSVDELRQLSEYVFQVMTAGGIWLVGLVVRARSERAEELTEQVGVLQRARDQQAREAVNLERTRIARELHDVIAHSVSVMGVQAGAAEQMLAVDPERSREPLRSIQETAREAIEELRLLLGVLREGEDRSALAPQPGLDGLGALVEEMGRAGLAVTLTVRGGPGRVSPGVELSAYRIIQEALTNTFKHAGAGEATVMVHHLPSALELEVIDTGGAKDAANASNGTGTGHGLIGMRERVSLYGGTITTGPLNEGGYRVRAVLPLDGRHS